MNKPYFYKIKNNLTGKYYVGCQYGKAANKDNFFVNYFTSSERIRDIIHNDGITAFEIISVLERDDAREYERYYLKKCYSLLGRDKFLSLFYNRNLAPGIINDNASIEKQNVTKRKHWTSGKMLKPIPPNWKGKQRSEQMKQRLAKSKQGHKVTEETRQKLRNANLGKKHSESTNRKRSESIAKNKNACGRKHWLFVSPEGVHYHTIGGKIARLHELGLSEGHGFEDYVNTGKSPQRGKNVGWLFFRGENIINGILTNVMKENIIYYE